MTEIIQFSLYYSKRPIFLLVLDAQSAFDRCLKEVLCSKLYSAGICDNTVNLINNRLANRSTIYEWDGVTMGPSHDQTGFEQGGINSGDYFKLYNNEQLQIVQDSELGVDIKSSTISAIGQADDVILASNDIRNLSLQAKLMENNCEQHRITLVAKKTKLVPIYQEKQSLDVEYAKLINPVTIAGNTVDFVDEAEHVGVLRSRSGNLPNINRRISAHKKAMAAISPIGIARAHRGSPASSLKMQEIYGTSVLLSGLASLVLSSKEVSILENHFKNTLENLQKLHKNTPKPVVYMLAGSLPLEALLHCRQLSLFFMISRLKNDVLHKHAKFILTSANPSCKSWFFEISKVCRLYKLPHPLSLLDRDLKKEDFKRLVKQKVKKHWQDHYTREIVTGNFKSLTYFHPSSFSIGRPSMLWVYSKHHPFESAKAIVVAKMLSGRYRTDWFKRHWSDNKDGYCLAPTCKMIPGDLAHMFVSCPSIQSVKKNMKQIWLQKTSSCPPLALFLDRMWTVLPETFLQFILDPSRFYEVAKLCEVFGPVVFSQIMYLTRSYAFYIDRFNRNLRT